MSADLAYVAAFIRARLPEDEAEIGPSLSTTYACEEQNGVHLDRDRALRAIGAKRAILGACTRAAEAGPDSPAAILALAVLDAMSTEWEHPRRPFVPDWTIRPGALLIAEAVKARGWTPDDLAERSGLDVATVRGLLAGSARIDRPAAEGLARAIGTSAEMWLNAQRLYDAAILRGATDTSGEHEHD